jgi:carbon starvation protein
MGALAIMVIAFAGYIIVYQLYGKFIGAKIFALSGAAKTPSVEMEDGIDYVPTKKEIIFGHHFTSIAGTGPLVGPAIAVIWGWVPAMIWVFVGSIVMGAVHDFGALIISMRNQGKSISEYTAKYVNNRTKVFFFLIVFLELWIVIAIFGLVIAIVFSMYPTSVLPVWLEIPIAIYLGYLIYKKGANVALWSIIAVIALYVTVVIGAYVPIALPTIAGIPATGGWTIILLVYAFIASTLPVTTLLQPRDFINSHQLLVAMTLLVLGVLFAGFGGRLDIVAPAVQLSPAKSPPMWPFLFITIACGAISGFHSLVSSGTSAKQVRDEQDSLFVGYGSMLLEGALATLVIIAVSAGIGIGYTAKSGETLTGVAAWTAHYASWASAGGLGNAVRALVDGSANMIRYVIAELFGGLNLKALTNRYIATFVAVVTAMILAFATGASGKGAMKLWPLFGATNQTLASLALIIITLYLKRRGGVKWVISGIPAVFMTVMTIWALILNQVKYGAGGNMLLTVINICILIIALWIATEGVIKFFATGEEPAAPAEPEIA